MDARIEAPTLSWRPLLQGQLNDDARDCVRAIVDDLGAYWRDPAGEPSLADGHAGWAILCAALAQSDHPLAAGSTGPWPPAACDLRAAGGRTGILCACRPDRDY
jgi:hypothetical protein